MDVTAQNPNVKDIWSMPDPATQNLQATAPDGQNPPISQKPSRESFGKPGLAGGGEGGVSGEVGKNWETNLKAEELLEKARKNELEHVAEIFKSPDRQKNYEVGKNTKSGESLKAVETLHSPETLKPPETLQSAEVQKPQPKEDSKKPVSKDHQVVQEKPVLKTKIVDQRTGKERLHRVDPARADATTKIADLKEQDFIEKVEKEHVRSIS